MDGMTAMARALKALFKRGASSDDGSVEKLQADRIDTAARAMSGWFPPGSGTPPSEALPAIWDRPAEFEASVAAFRAASQSLRSAAEAHDRSAIEAATRQVDRACRSCHDRFREPR